MSRTFIVRFRLFTVCFLLLSVAACATNLSRSFSDSISNSILNQNDPATVRDGAPAYMLMLDGFILDNPGNADLLRAAADLYGTYAMVFVDEPERARRLTTKSLGYARKALCLTVNDACALLDTPFEAFSQSLSIQEQAIPFWYSYATAWVGWVQSHGDDWQARTDIPRIIVLLEKLAEIKPDYQWGRANLYLGVLNSQLPPAMGGKPEQARKYFETALHLSQGKDLIGKVYYARNYARLLFDRELHDRLLQEVLDAEVDYPGLTLSNVIARGQAHALLAESGEYFGE